MEEIEGGNIVYAVLKSIFPGMNIPVDLVMSWLVVAILLLVAFLATRQKKLVPGTLQNMVETAFEGFAGSAREMMGETGEKLHPLFLTLFLFILVANLIGLIPGLKSPTSNININLAMAVIVAFTTQYVSIKHNGLIGYLKHFCGPPFWLAPLFIIIRVIEEIARPFSLTVRLFCNILAKEILLGVLVYLMTLFFFSEEISSRFLVVMPVILRPLILLLGMLVSFVQALVFTRLSMVFIAGAVSEH